MSAERETWTGRFGFVMATAGFAIGLGNIWRFPYLTGSNGGGAFLLLYVLFAFLICIPLFTAEVALGRKVRLTPIAGMKRLTGSATSPWSLIGWLPVAVAALIQSYYVMLIGWIVGYFVMIVTGRLAVGPGESFADLFSGFIANPLPVFGYTWGVIALIAYATTRGLRGGIERVSSFGMPVLLVLVVGLAIRSMSFDGAGAGLAWYLTPDFSALTGATVLAALGQAFYSIGVGMAGAFAYGSYLDPKSSDVPGSAAIVIACDTGVAFLAGLVIFPALFAFGLEPDQGPGLLFVTMSTLFSRMPAGQLFGAAFFILLLLAGLTSAVALFETLIATVADSSGLDRRKSTWVVSIGHVVLSAPIILSQGPWSEVRLFGRDLFGLADYTSGSVLLPIGAFLLAVYTAYS